MRHAGKVYIGVDFDGTCVYHEYPQIGLEVPYARDCMLALVAAGYLLILNTTRSGKELQEAVQWFADRGIPLYGVNENPDQKSWTTSPKVYASYYIDDAAVGCPLCQDSDMESRPYVNWLAITKFFFPNAGY